MVNIVISSTNDIFFKQHCILAFVLNVSNFENIDNEKDEHLNCSPKVSCPKSQSLADYELI